MTVIAVFRMTETSFQQKRIKSTRIDAEAVWCFVVIEPEGRQQCCSSLGFRDKDKLKTEVHQTVLRKKGIDSFRFLQLSNIGNTTFHQVSTLLD